jgi:carotenoid cleavage dioxygenase-like enzyme
MTALSPSQVARMGGADISSGMVAAANGDTIPAGCHLHVKNGSGSAVTVTLVMPTGTGPFGTSYANQALTPTVAATTGDMLYGPFQTGHPAVDPATGLITFNYSATASVTVKAVQIQD